MEKTTNIDIEKTLASGSATSFDSKSPHIFSYSSKNMRLNINTTTYTTCP
jgi:hypothetical protein